MEQVLYVELVLKAINGKFDSLTKQFNIAIDRIDVLEKKMLR